MAVNVVEENLNTMVNKMKASSRLYLLIFVMSIFIITVGAYGILQIKAMSLNTQTLYRDRVLPLQQLTTIRYSFSVRILSSAEQMQMAQSTFEKTKQQIEEAENSIAVNWKAYMLTYLTPEEAQLAKQASVLMDQSAKSIEKLKAILNKKDSPALDNIIRKELYPAINPVIAKITELIDLQVRVSGEVYNKSTQVYNTSLKKSILLILLSMVFAIPFSYYLVESVKELIKNLQASNAKTAESEGKYRSLVEHAGDAIFLVAEDTAIIDVNHSACELLGYSRQELLSMKALDVYPPDELGTPPVQWELLRMDKTLLNERRLQRKDGTKVEVEISRRMLADGQGYLAIVRDITERKKAEEQLKEYKHFFYHSNDLSSIANVQGYSEMLNPQFEKLLGYPEEEMIKNQFYTFIHPDDIPSTLQEIEKLKTGGTSINFVNRYRKKNGDYLWFDWNTTSDRVTGKLYAIARDITERKQTETILQESERKYRNIFENVQDVFYQTSLAGTVLEVSPSIKYHTGFSREEMLGASAANIYYDPADREKGIKLLKERGELTDYEFRLKSNTGEPVYVSLNARLIPAPN
jgi:PAS domain S-box-containing protein